jgi:hypothetical protein
MAGLTAAKSANCESDIRILNGNGSKIADLGGDCDTTSPGGIGWPVSNVKISTYDREVRRSDAGGHKSSRSMIVLVLVIAGGSRTDSHFVLRRPGSQGNPRHGRCLAWLDRQNPEQPSRSRETVSSYRNDLDRHIAVGCRCRADILDLSFDI